VTEIEQSTKTKRDLIEHVRCDIKFLTPASLRDAGSR